MDIDDHSVLTDALELHYIDMKAAVKMINEKGISENDETAMLLKWLAIITEKEIKDKSIIEEICQEEEAINMAVSTLARLSEDKLTRLDYLRRQDEIMLFNRRLDEYKHRAEIAEAEIEKLRKKIAELES